MLKVPESGEGELSLRKRQTILADRNVAQAPAVRRVSRRTSMHIRNRSIQQAEPDEAPPVPAESIEAADAQQLLAHMETLQLKAEELEQSDIAAVRRSYETLVGVSRSVAELPPQIAKLRKQVGDLATIAEALKADAEAVQEQEDLHRYSNASQSQVSSTQPGRRASMLMLNNAWRQDIVALSRKVEGAQMYLPPIPGRHVVSEVAGCYELNPVTWTSLKPVHIFLISDHLLVAKKSTRSLVVDHCWALQELQASSRESALQVQVRGKTFVYRVPQVEAILRDMRRQVRSLAEDRDRAARPQSEMRHSSIAATQEIEIARAHAKELANVDLLIAKRDWPAATNVVLGEAIPGMEERRALLERLLLQQAHKGHALPLLVQLGRANDAIKLFLTARAKIIEQRVQEIAFPGDIVAHLSQVAVVYFQNIIATVKAFCAAFQQDSYTSQVVAWTKQQLELYAGVFNRQLYKIRPGSRIFTQCVDMTKRESAQLSQLGLNMDFLLDYLWA